MRFQLHELGTACSYGASSAPRDEDYEFLDQVGFFGIFK